MRRHGQLSFRGDLFDVGRLAGAVKAGDQNAPVIGKARENCQCGPFVEQVVRIFRRHPLGTLGKGRHADIAIDAEYLTHGNGDIR